MTRFLITSLSAVLLLAGCNRHNAEPKHYARSETPAPVRVTTITPEEVSVPTELAGTIRPVQRAVLAARIVGTITLLPIALGQEVRAGDLLLKISAEEIVAHRAQACAELDLAARQLARARTLLAKGASTPEEVRDLEDRCAHASAVARESEVMVDYTELRAPFAGFVARKLAHVGDLAAPGAPLLEIEGAGDFEVEVDIPDSLAARLTVGAEFSAEDPATGAAFTARVAELATAADPVARAFRARLAVPAGSDVRSGDFTRVRVPTSRAPVMLVPTTAVTPSGQMERVFVVDADDRAALRLVRTGGSFSARVEILAGLAAGDRIVVDPPAGLRDGQKLSLAP